LAFGVGTAGADGCPPQQCGTSGAQQPGSGLLLVRPNGQQGPLVAYDARTGKERFTVPRGILSADGSRYVSANRRGVTFWDVTKRARKLQQYGLGRAWPGAISADGYRIVLQERSRRNTSRFALFDAARARVIARVELRGGFQAEALSPDAKRLYLIHWRRNGYDLQTYDFATRRVRPTTLAEPDEKMTGTAWTAVTTRDGRWLLTLYVGGAEGGFVHALDLRRGVAHCIDLPWRAVDLNRYGAAALALSPDDRTLYLANPVLGRIAVVDLRKLDVVRDVRFRGIEGNVVFGITPTASVSPRGRVLAFGFQRKVWTYDTATRAVRGPFVVSERVPARTGVPQHVTGLAFTPDGRRLLALRTDRQSVVLDSATGRLLRGVTPGELFTIHLRGNIGPTIGYGARAGQRFFLPLGHGAANGSVYFSSHPSGAGSTIVERYDPSSGRLVAVRHIPGRWNLGAVSASGSTLAFAHQRQRTTYVEVLDARTYRPLHTRKLRGVYTLDAVDETGSRLFLIQHYRSGSYAVRALDFARNRLWTATLREKGEKEQPAMTGLAAGQVASPDGDWLLTLYLNTKARKAFVHALNLRHAYAVCIDLPSRSRTLRPLRDYALTLAPDGDVYAANGALGVLARLDLHRQTVVETLHFRGTGRSGGWASSALARHGRTLWFSSGRHVWRYDMDGDRVAGHQVVPAPVLGLAPSRDGLRLFAARVDGRVATLAA
jgi:WD40 repeat protein